MVYRFFFYVPISVVALLLVTGCQTERLKSIRGSISYFESGQKAVRPWLLNLNNCINDAKVMWKVKYPAKTYPDFQDFLKKEYDFTVKDYADTRLVRGMVERRAVLDLSSGYSACVKETLRRAKRSNRYIREMIGLLGPRHTQELINISDYLNGSQSRGNIVGELSK